MDANEKARAFQLARMQVEHKFSPAQLHAYMRSVEAQDDLPFAEAACFEAELAARGIRLLFPTHPEWPSSLSEHVRRAPAFLYARGAPLPKGAGLAVVGSRTCSDYPLRITREIVRRWALLRPDGFVVTGGGMGVDAAALLAATDIGFPAVVVLASDVARPTPRVHADLFERVAREGVLLSENAPGLPIFPSMFPYRNRLIPCLAEQTVVVRAAARSGSLHTLRHASTTGKPIWAVVGPIDDPGFSGNLEGIRQGLAKPLLSLDDLGCLIEKNRKGPSPCPSLSAEEKAIWSSLRGGPLRPDDVAERVGLTAASVMRIMLGLELKGLLSREAGNVYRRQSPR